jgi:hypothetical protein
VPDFLAFVFLLLAFVVLAVAARLYFALGREIARAGVAGHVPGTGSHAGGGRAGDRKSTTDPAKSLADSDDDARRLHMKRELLERWATEGKPIDAIAEAHAELVVLEVEERSRAWRNFTAAAADEPVDAERPFAS